MSKLHLEIVGRDPAYTGVQVDKGWIGMVFFDDPFPYYRDDDETAWIDGIEAQAHGERPPGKGRTPYHFYIGRSGTIYEGLGWGTYSDWHDVKGKNQDVPHNGANALAVKFLGDGETEFTVEAATAAYHLLQLYREVTPAGAGGRAVEGSLARWIKNGMQRPEGYEEPTNDDEETEEGSDESEVEGMGDGADAGEESGGSSDAGHRRRRRKS